jgi:hypothetical protein
VRAETHRQNTKSENGLPLYAHNYLALPCTLIVPGA